jgi:TonB-dependent SusC/RagA subfamily outer membrane receptor
VKGADLKFPARNISTNIAGQVAGLIAIQRNGEPGYDNADFWIRGVSTFAGGTRPLVLVDGVPRSLNDIETDEIETFSVLKDAAATAVYGAEGANGVVIITSKRGQARAPVISFRAEHSISNPERLPTFVTSDQYLALFNEALKNDGQSPIFSDELIAKYKSNTDPDLYPNVDWVDVMLKDNTKKQRYTLNVRGGSEKAKYFVSGAYFSEEGVFKNAPADRYKTNI